MMETRAVVVSLEGNQAVVESIQGGGCGSCDKENGCGSGKLSQLFGGGPRRFRVRNDANAQVGAMVQVTVEEGTLLRSALLLYVLPLALLLAGAILGAQWVSALERDAYSALGGGAGLVVGFVLAKLLALRQQLTSVAQPVITQSSIVSWH